MAVLNKSEYYELPTKYNQTIVRLLLQSPKRIYAYWEVSEDTAENFSKNIFDYDNSTPILRVINLTKNYFYEIPVDPFANNYYIDVEDENCNYKVCLGRKYNNNFADIYVSNQITVPNTTSVDFSSEDNEVLFKNYICLDSRKMKVSLPKYSLRQDYGDLPFSDDNISSMNNLK